MLEGFQRCYFLLFSEELTVTLGNPIFLWNGITLMVLTRQAQLESGNQGAAGAQRSRSGHHSSVQLPELETMGTMSEHSWGPAKSTPRTRLCSGTSREGLQSQPAAPSTLGSPYWIAFLLTCFLLQQVPPHDPGGSATGTSWVPYPLIKVFTAWR